MIALVTGCSSGSDATPSGSKTSSATPATGSARVQAFAAVRRHPCGLLPVSSIRAALPTGRVGKTAVVSGAQCQYTLADGRTVEVELLPPQTARSLRDRTLGTTAAGPGRRSIRLDTPGVGLLVGRGRSLALLALRAQTLSPAQQAAAVRAVDRMADTVRRRLPVALSPSKQLLARDLCEVVPASVLGPDFVAGDARVPGACAYRTADGTQVRLQMVPRPTDGDTDPGASLGDPWPDAGNGARWQGITSAIGGAGNAFVPLRPGSLQITVSSPVQRTAELQRLSKRVVDRVSAAAGN